MNLAIANANRFGLRFVMQGFVPVAPLCIDPFAHEKHGDPRKDLARHVLLCYQPTHCSKRPHNRSIALVRPPPEQSVANAEQATTALAKALAVIDAVLAFPHPVSPPDLTDRRREGRGTVHRRLRQLEHEGLLLRDPRGPKLCPPSEALVETLVAHGVTPHNVARAARAPAPSLAFRGRRTYRH